MCRLLAVQHCHVGVTRKSDGNSTELEDIACYSQYNKTSGQLADDVSKYCINFRAVERLIFLIELIARLIIFIAH